MRNEKFFFVMLIIFIASLISCVTISVVRLVSFIILNTSSLTESLVLKSKAEKGSSKNSISGLIAKVLIKATA